RLRSRPARITPRNSEAARSALFWDYRTGRWCGHLHPFAEIRERESCDGGLGPMGKAGTACRRFGAVGEAVAEVEGGPHLDEAAGAVNPDAARPLGERLRCLMRRADVE